MSELTFPHLRGRVEQGVLVATLTVTAVQDDDTAEAARLDTLDIGGGFPVVYRTEMPTLEDFCRVVSRGLSQMFPAGVRIIAEPGRCISGDAMNSASAASSSPDPPELTTLLKIEPTPADTAPLWRRLMTASDT